MNNCEIVDNVACGQAFKYCRTHKVEPHQCPRLTANIEDALFKAVDMVKQPDDKDWHCLVHVSHGGDGRCVKCGAANPFHQREFKVGDKVRCLVREFGNETVGKVYVVQTVRKTGWELDFTVEADDDGQSNAYRSSHFEVVE